MKLSKRENIISPSITLEITAKAKELRESGLNVISFGVGEPDFNTPSNVIEEAYKAMCKLASTEAYVQNEDFDENGSCAIYFDGYNKEINLHYDNDNTWCYYRIEIIK